jgi:hypothetical protein
MNAVIEPDLLGDFNLLDGWLITGILRSGTLGFAPRQGFVLDSEPKASTSIPVLSDLRR